MTKNISDIMRRELKKLKPKVAKGSEEQFNNVFVEITSVPYFDMYLTHSPNGMHQSFSGAQPVETIVAVLRRLKLVAKV